MDGVSAGAPRGGNDRRYEQVGRFAEKDRLIGASGMGHATVIVGVDRDGAVAHGARGAHDAASDLAAVGDEDLGEAAHPTQAGRRFSRKAATPSRPSGPRKAAANASAA